jgi:hypothetical protein
MVVFIKVWSDFSGKQLGTLEIGKNEASATSDGRWYEWQGVNGTSDGGTWHWSNSDFYGNEYVMMLVSNVTKITMAHLENKDWGTSEPSEPYFEPKSSGVIAYHTVGAKWMTATWGKV